jgi:hypothetical protein
MCSILIVRTIRILYATMKTQLYLIRFVLISTFLVTFSYFFHVSHYFYADYNEKYLKQNKFKF